MRHLGHHLSMEVLCSVSGHHTIHYLHHDDDGHHDQKVHRPRVQVLWFGGSNCSRSSQLHTNRRLAWHAEEVHQDL